MENKRKNKVNPQKKNAFFCPDGYFENLSQIVRYKIEFLEEQHPFPNLNRLKDLKVYKVPENYFQKKEVALISQIRQPASKPQIIFWLTKSVSIAAAAILLVVLGTWLYIKDSTNEIESCQNLACLDRSELIKTIEQDEIDIEDCYDYVNTDLLYEANQEQKYSPDTIEEDEIFNDEFIKDIP